MGEVFNFSKTVYLADTNAFGNTYFAKYFEWQGMAREDFFRTIAGGATDVLREGIKYITISATMNYKKETRLFDEVEICVKPQNITLTTVELLFTFTDKVTKEEIAEGNQRIGFSDMDGTIIPIPQRLLEGAVKYLDQEEMKNLQKVMDKIGKN